ncbi:MAG: glutathione binding-like protein [Bdellovibrionaceae bacterium]|nr:glutathione binding-like protein [Pseudobdellovibrionaceae bacterium]
MSAKLQLYSLATPNGQKVSIALEEMGLDYEAHRIDILKGDQFKPDFIAINPNSKIPALVDPEGDNGKPLNIFESGAILVYLAEKSGKFLPKDPAERSKTLQWLFFQMGGAGPMFGQFGHFFKYAKDKCDHPYPLERYKNESQRLLQVIDTQLEKNKFIAGDELTIADMALAPWIACLSKFYNADEILELSKFEHINAWMETLWSRPGFKKGAEVCA